jgi:hypothetical protein
MNHESLAELIRTLNPTQQESVREFVEFLKQRDACRQPAPQQTPFLDAVDEFVAEHPELLRRLAE